MAKTSHNPASDLANMLGCEELFSRPKELAAALRSTILHPSTQPSGFHRFFVSTNVAGRNPTQDILLQHTIPTAFLRLALTTQFRKFTKRWREHLLMMWSGPMPHVAWRLYEPLVFYLLLETEEGVECKLGADGASFRLGPGLTLHPDVLNIDDPHFTPTDNCLYVLPGGYPALDALVVTKDNLKRRVMLLQISTSGPHELRLAGVRRAMELFGKAAAEIQWSVLFVTPSERGQNIAASHGWEVEVAVSPEQSLRKTRKPTGTAALSYTVPLGWLRIDDQVHSVLELLVSLSILANGTAAVLTALQTEMSGLEKNVVSTIVQDLEDGGEHPRKKPRVT